MNGRDRGHRTSKLAESPTDSEMIYFNKLLKSGDSRANSALYNYNRSDDRDSFYRDIISMIRHPEMNIQSSRYEQKSHYSSIDGNRNRLDSRPDYHNSKVENRKVCTFFASKGWCKFGAQCVFMHIRDNSNPHNSQKQSMARDGNHSDRSRSQDNVSHAHADKPIFRGELQSQYTLPRESDSTDRGIGNGIDMFSSDMSEALNDSLRYSGVNPNTVDDDKYYPDDRLHSVISDSDISNFRATSASPSNETRAGSSGGNNVHDDYMQIIHDLLNGVVDSSLSTNTTSRRGGDTGVGVAPAGSAGGPALLESFGANSLDARAGSSRAESFGGNNREADRDRGGAMTGAGLANLMSMSLLPSSNSHSPSVISSHNDSLSTLESSLNMPLNGGQNDAYDEIESHMKWRSMNVSNSNSVGGQLSPPNDVERDFIVHPYDAHSSPLGGGHNTGAVNRHQMQQAQPPMGMDLHTRQQVHHHQQQQRELLAQQQDNRWIMQMSQRLENDGYLNRPDMPAHPMYNSAYPDVASGSMPPYGAPRPPYMGGVPNGYHPRPMGGYPPQQSMHGHEHAPPPGMYPPMMYPMMAQPPRQPFPPHYMGHSHPGMMMQGGVPQAPPPSMWPGYHAGPPAPHLGYEGPTSSAAMMYHDGPQAGGDSALRSVGGGYEERDEGVRVEGRPMAAAQYGGYDDSYVNDTRIPHYTHQAYPNMLMQPNSMDYSNRSPWEVELGNQTMNHNQYPPVRIPSHVEFPSNSQTLQFEMTSRNLQSGDSFEVENQRLSSASLQVISEDGPMARENTHEMSNGYPNASRFAGDELSLRNIEGVRHLSNAQEQTISSANGGAYATDGGAKEINKSKALLSFIKSAASGEPIAQLTQIDSSRCQQQMSSKIVLSSDVVKAKASVEGLDEQIASEKGGVLDADETGPSGKDAKDKERPKSDPFRVTRNQVGTLTIRVDNADTDMNPSGSHMTVPSRFSMKPGKNMVVQWTIPMSVYQDIIGSNSKGAICVCLTRYGGFTNANSIISRNIVKDSKGKSQQRNISIHPQSDEARGILNENEKHLILCNEINFHAPKGAGSYVYRMYNATSNETHHMTLATSEPFSVYLTGRDVTSNLKFILDFLKTKKFDSFPVITLHNIFQYMRSTGAPVAGLDLPLTMLQQCVDILLSGLRKSTGDILSKSASTSEDKPNDDAEEVDISDGKEGASTEKTSEDYAKSRKALKLHSQIHECLLALRGNHICWGMLASQQRQQVVTELEELYCPILCRFFANRMELDTIRNRELGFVPVTIAQTSMASSCLTNVIKKLTVDLHALSSMPSFYPSSNFHQIRQGILNRIEQYLIQYAVKNNNTNEDRKEEGWYPNNIRLAIFGSSANSFGTDSSDVDMCIQYPSNVSCPATPSERASVMETVGRALESAGMENVQVRSTSRIPIVLFLDPVSGLECDVAFNNVLAIRNTQLLALYNEVDPRVKILAYLIKYWAKRRDINCPGEGTLSSYGYILCLIQFLQTRHPPVLPNLQKLFAPNYQPSYASLNLSNGSIPRRWETHPVDSCRCNTYFFDNVAAAKSDKQNMQSVGELLFQFFRYYSYEFDFFNSVVSVRNGSPLLRMLKLEQDGWNLNTRLSIEDPFETWYDIAHVIKGPQMTYIRKEFLRAFTLISNASDSDSILTEICAASDTVPSFVKSRSRSNTNVTAGVEQVSGSV